MIVLACETSTLLGSVAVLKDQAVLAYKESLRQGSHSDVLNVFVETVLNEAGLQLSDVDLFASGIGPGSFTGIRISLNTIKTFSYCYNKPCIGVDSLLNLATQCSLQTLSDHPIVAMINAYKNMVYIATYKMDDGRVIVLKPPQVVRVQNLANYLDTDCYVVGDGYAAYKNFLISHVPKQLLRPEGANDEPTAQVLGQLAMNTPPASYVAWNELLPIYLRESEAEENAKGIRFQPLF